MPWRACLDGEIGGHHENPPVIGKRLTIFMIACILLLRFFPPFYFLPFFISRSQLRSTAAYWYLTKHEQHSNILVSRSFMMYVLVCWSRLACTGLFTFHQPLCCRSPHQKLEENTRGRGITFPQPLKGIHGGLMLLLTGCRLSMPASAALLLLLCWCCEIIECQYS